MSYPKDYLIPDIEPNENTVFVLIPFHPEYEEVYSEIRKVCLEIGMKCRRADEIFLNRAIMENILDGITRSEIIIADITEKSPNVYYELGIAHSFRDQDAVILTSHNIKNSPFDIHHRVIMVYDKENFFGFRVELKKRIEASRLISRKKEYFRILFRLNGIKFQEAELFIETAEKLSTSKFNLIYNIIKPYDGVIEESEINELENYFVKLLDFKDGAIKNAAYLLKINVYTSDVILTKHEAIVKQILKKSNRDIIHLDDIEAFTFIAEYCFVLIEKKRVKFDALNWIVDYLHNYRMGRIDIVRSKIENFLIKVNDEDADMAILEMLNSQRSSVRESAADICGQKRLVASIGRIINALKIESGAHVARSFIAALTRLNAVDSLPIIYDWMINNKDKWGNQAVSASLKGVAFAAIKELDNSGEFISNFEKVLQDSK